MARRHQYTQTRSSEAVQCRTDDRSQKSAYHWSRDAAATHVSQLDQLVLLYTAGTLLIPRPTLVGHRKGRPLEAMMMTYSEQTAIDH